MTTQAKKEKTIELLNSLNGLDRNDALEIVSQARNGVAALKIEGRLDSSKLTSLLAFENVKGFVK